MRNPPKLNAYGEYLLWYGMPKDTKEDQEARAIQYSAFERAFQTHLELMSPNQKLCLVYEVLGEHIKDLNNKI